MKVKWSKALVCIFVTGHRYDPSIMRMRPMPMIYCDRCGAEF